MRKICYVSGTRADYGLMKSVLRAIEADEELDLSILVTGMHLAQEYGFTANEIRAAGFKIAGKVPVPLDPASGATMARNIGRMLIAFTDALERDRPDILLLLGDRGEMLAGATAAIHLNIPVAHVHGGERSGTVDESVRHAVSKLSHLHFKATMASRQRLVRMGELPENIFCTGAPGLDGMAEVALVPKAELLASYGMDPQRPFTLLVYHPVLQEADEAGEQMRAILTTLGEFDQQILALMPNSDAGSAGVRAALEEEEGQPHITILAHLPRTDFLSAMAYADAMVGNSSSAIIEAASLGTPVLNIGTRQNLRDRNENTRDSSNNIDDIRAMLATTLSGGRFPIANVYGDGHASGRIVQVLRNVMLGPVLLAKGNSY